MVRRNFATKTMESVKQEERFWGSRERVWKIQAGDKKRLMRRKSEEEDRWLLR
jgi:hypothetical protein